MAYDYSNPPQVTITITTDYLYTAEFLRDLACAIEDEMTDLDTYETGQGCAEITWPDEAYEDEEE